MTLGLVIKGMNDRVGIRIILFGVFTLNLIMKPNLSEVFIIYYCTPYV